MDGHQRGTFCINPFVRSQGSLQQEATVSPSILAGKKRAAFELFLLSNSPSPLRINACRFRIRKSKDALGYSEA
jgi:hypothetical protein